MKTRLRISSPDFSMTKPQHGGKRQGAGRKAAKGKTIVIRIPVALLEAVRKLISDFRQ